MIVTKINEWVTKIVNKCGKESQILESIPGNSSIEGRVMVLFDIFDGQVNLFLQPSVDAVHYFPAHFISSFLLCFSEQHSEVIKKLSLELVFVLVYLLLLKKGRHRVFIG